MLFALYDEMLKVQTLVLPQERTSLLMEHFLTDFEKDRQRQNRIKNRQKLWDGRLQPCHDCKLRWHPSCMTFDHIERRTVTKSKNMKQLSAVLHYNPLIFDRQLRGGHWVCLNCHRIREVSRDINDPKISPYDKDIIREWLGKLGKGALIA